MIIKLTLIFITILVLLIFYVVYYNIIGPYILLKKY